MGANGNTMLTPLFLSPPSPSIHSSSHNSTQIDARVAQAAEVERRKIATATMFSVIHQSVVKMSRKMEGEIRRKNFVTPINYLELVSGYKELLAEKRKELGDAADKLANGLEKIDDTRVKVCACVCGNGGGGGGGSLGDVPLVLNHMTT
jgi:hypothetical protein